VRLAVPPGETRAEQGEGMPPGSSEIPCQHWRFASARITRETLDPVWYARGIFPAPRFRQILRLIGDPRPEGGLP